MWRMCNHRGWLWSQMTQLTSNAVTWAIITKRDSQRIWYVGTSISGPWRRVRVRGRLTSWSERMPLGYVSQYWYSKILHHQMCFPRFYLHQFLRVCYHETPFFSLFFLITNVRFFYIFFSVTPSTPKKKNTNTRIHWNIQSLDMSAGDLLSRTHEELVLLLIQLRRQNSATARAIEQCCTDIHDVQVV